MPPLRVLFITPYVPSLLRTRPYGFLTHMARNGHRLTLLSASTSAHDDAAVAAIRDLCERIEVVPVSRLRAVRNCSTGVANGIPFQALYANSPQLRARLDDLIRPPGSFDVVHVEHLRAALLGLGVRGLPRVYDAVDCITELFELTQHHGGTWLSRAAAALDLPRTRRFEAQLVQRFERVVVTSETEAAALTRMSRTDGNRAAVRVIPNGVDLEYFVPSDARRDPATLLYVGRMSYHANVTAVRDLIERIMPAVWEKRPDVKVVICGADPARIVRRLAQRHGGRVSVTGTVPDVRPYLERATISVNPLRYAAGIQNKVLEAMATATPVITSPAAIPGLPAVAGTDLLIADDFTTFAAQIGQLLDDPERRRRIGAAGRLYVETHHHWGNAAKTLEAVYQDAISSWRDAGTGQRG